MHLGILCATADATITCMQLSLLCMFSSNTVISAALRIHCKLGHKCGCLIPDRVLLPMQMGIANRDIKLENTLLMDTSERPVLKLCDFGYSKDELCASISKTMCGKKANLS